MEGEADGRRGGIAGKEGQFGAAAAVAHACPACALQPPQLFFPDLQQINSNSLSVFKEF